MLHSHADLSCFCCSFVLSFVHCLAPDCVFAKSTKKYLQIFSIGTMSAWMYIRISVLVQAYEWADSNKCLLVYEQMHVYPSIFISLHMYTLGLYAEDHVLVSPHFLQTYSHPSRFSSTRYVRNPTSKTEHTHMQVHLYCCPDSIDDGIEEQDVCGVLYYHIWLAIQCCPNGLINSIKEQDVRGVLITTYDLLCNAVSISSLIVLKSKLCVLVKNQVARGLVWHHPCKLLSNVPGGSRCPSSQQPEGRL